MLIITFLGKNWLCIERYTKYFMLIILQRNERYQAIDLKLSSLNLIYLLYKKKIK